MWFRPYKKSFMKLDALIESAASVISESVGVYEITHRLLFKEEDAESPRRNYKIIWITLFLCLCIFLSLSFFVQYYLYLTLFNVHVSWKTVYFWKKKKYNVPFIHVYKCVHHLMFSSLFSSCPQLSVLLYLAHILAFLQFQICDYISSTDIITSWSNYFPQLSRINIFFLNLPTTWLLKKDNSTFETWKLACFV